MTQKDKKNIRIGIFVLGATVLLGVGYLFITKKGFFDDTTKLYVFADDVSELSTETPILINGFQNRIIDSTLVKKMEPTLKEISQTIGKALLEYGEEGEVDKDIQK